MAPWEEPGTGCSLRITNASMPGVAPGDCRFGRKRTPRAGVAPLERANLPRQPSGRQACLSPGPGVALDTVREVRNGRSAGRGCRRTGRSSPLDPAAHGAPVDPVLGPCDELVRDRPVRERRPPWSLPIAVARRSWRRRSPADAARTDRRYGSVSICAKLLSCFVRSCSVGFLRVELDRRRSAARCHGPPDRPRRRTSPPSSTAEAVARRGRGECRDAGDGRPVRTAAPGRPPSRAAMAAATDRARLFGMWQLGVDGQPDKARASRSTSARVTTSRPRSTSRRAQGDYSSGRPPERSEMHAALAGDRPRSASSVAADPAL